MLLGPQTFQNGVVLAVAAVLSAFTMAAEASAAFSVAIAVTHADADIVSIVQVRHRGRTARGERGVEDVVRAEQQGALREIEGIAVACLEGFGSGRRVVRWPLGRDVKRHGC